MYLFRSSVSPLVRVAHSFPSASPVQVARSQRSVWVGLQFLFDLFRSRAS